ncbi:MAG: hypothetical protein COA45_08390 [Zetaproteobacteria bacterium]|nr:MAG: hypothetical protein COA45_08390 [Zetaproteobacteria bacterium]
MKYLLFTTLLTLCFSSPVKAEYMLNKDVTHYSVNESDPSKLLAEVTKVMKKPCKSRSRNPVFSCMLGSVKATHKSIEVGKGVCGIYRFKLVAKQHYLIPKWVNRGQHSIEMQNKWIDLLNDRTERAQHHGKIFKKSMLKAHDRIMKLTTLCSKVTRSISKILDKAQEEAQEEYKEFYKESGDSIGNFPN